MDRFKRLQWVGTIVVLLILGGYFIYTHWIEVVPYYAVKYDPEMQYFSNSLALFKGVPYAYIDHPGTPLEVIGTFLLALTRPITRGQGELFIPYHLANPRLFMTMAHALVTSFCFLTVVVLILKSWPVRNWGSLIASIGLGVTYFAVYAPLTYRTLDWWTHNSFNFPFGTLLMMAVVLRLQRSESLRTLETIGFGLLAGLLLCVQLYFIAWSIGIILALVLFTAFFERNVIALLKTGLLASAGMLVGFFIGFSPVMHRFRSFFLWVQRLISHQGRYGQGPEGITTPGQFIDNLLWMWNRGEVVFLVAFAAITLLIFTFIRRRGQIARYPGWWSASLAAFVQFALLWLLLGKHPGVNYLISVAALLPIILLLAFRPVIEQNNARPKLPLAAGLVLMALFLASLAIAVNDHHTWLRQVREGEQAIDQAIGEYAETQGQPRKDLVILWGYGVPSRCYALRYGNGSTEEGALHAEIDDLCPNEWVYDVWGGYVELPWAYESLEENSDWDIIILPEDYLPAESEELADIIISDIPTTKYGNIAIMRAK